MPIHRQFHVFLSGRVILDDFREAYYWLSQNTPDHARVMSWWDYGYQIAGMANRTTLVDNNTWNNSHIALVSMVCLSLGVFFEANYLPELRDFSSYRWEKQCRRLKTRLTR